MTTTQNQNQTINLSKIECIPPKNTIATINQFIINTTDFINRFAFFSEEKLLSLDESIDRLETQLILLEKKLETIPPEYFANINTQVSQISAPAPDLLSSNNQGGSNVPPPPPNLNITQNAGALPPPPLNLLLGNTSAGGLPPLPPPLPGQNTGGNNNTPNTPAEEAKPQEEKKPEFPGNYSFQF